MAKKFGTDRRTVLLESAGAPVAAVPLEVADDPCRVLLSSTGLLARTANGDPFAGDEDAKRAKHDVIVSAVPATARGDVGAVTSTGRLLRLDGDRSAAAAGHARGAQSLGRRAGFGVPHAGGRTRKSSASPRSTSPRPAWRSAPLQGVVKRVVPDYPANKDELEVITLKEGDRIVGAAELRTGEEDLVFITSDAQLLRYPAAQVRPQGRPAGGMAGVKLTDGRRGDLVHARWIRRWTRWCSRWRARTARWTTRC